MKKKRSALILFALIMVVITLLAACKPNGNEVSQESQSKSESKNASVSGNSKAVNVSNTSGSISKGNSSSGTITSGSNSEAPNSNGGNTTTGNESINTNNSEANSTFTEVSIDQPDDTKPVILNVLGCTLTDNNCFVIVGKCEEGATITATTGNQTVTTSSDSGFYSVRIKKQSTVTRVTLEANGSSTEKYTIDVTPKIPTSEMWPIVGGDGYNFFFQKMMPDFKQTNRLDDNQLSYLTNKIQGRISSLQEASPNTEIVYMIVPSKASIYPELVPSDYKKGTSESRLEQVNNALQSGGATVINLLDVFAEHKNDDYKLYWKTDSHWTDYGAYVAYDALFNYIRNDFSAAKPRKFSDFTFAGDYYEGGDMVFYMMMNQKSVKEYCHYRTPNFTMNDDILNVKRYRSATYLMYDEQVVPKKTFNTNHSNLPDLYVMRDSYSTQMYDILADRGNITTYKSMWDYTFNISDISRNAPDYVIYIIAEWNIDSILQS